MQSISFNLGMMIDTTHTLEFHTNLNELDVHWRSQVYKEAKTSSVILLCKLLNLSSYEMSKTF